MSLLQTIADDLRAAVFDGELSYADRARSNLHYMQFAARVVQRMLGLSTRGLTTLADVVEQRAATEPDRDAVRTATAVVCYGELDARANRYAHWARAAGVEPAGVVALLMRNEPDFLAAWLGLTKIGAVTALLNTNLVERPLAHSINVVRPRHIIVGEGLADAFQSARQHLSAKPIAWYRGEAPRGGRDLAEKLARAKGSRPERLAAPNYRDRMCFIYTSGTTGLPKAASITHLRAVAGAVAASAALAMSSDDRSFIALPLYHASGSLLAAGGALVSGASVILVPKFSASRFWSDCVDLGATVFQYIGELCRFLLNQPRTPAETRHSVRACMGNGLRPDVWPQFQQRFKIPQVIEFYGATEGNVAFVNLDNRVGSIGRIPPALRGALGIRLLKYDVARDELVRDAHGHYVESRTGEPGEAVGRIWLPGTFDGYSDPAASEKKILRNVFAGGDSYFRTGDLLRYDADGYYYFVDRVGDTFRWRGENVAASEVAETLARYPGVRDVCVYGVEVPGAEGRAGMAAIVSADDVDLARLGRHVHKHLPAYARPLFLRQLSAMTLTGTFKYQTRELARESFNPEVVTDPLFFLDTAAHVYQPLDRTHYDDIVNGRLRL
ncbi:MAG TPA: long-chain-acyl-CoA synthetase [Candidatus Binatia bacterium]|nr:long-chain-acyl-CoA synthetase [Candidatus Binatia bacterium]